MASARVHFSRPLDRERRLMPSLRPTDCQTLIKVFAQDGFTFNRQRGDHLIYTKPGIKRPLVIPVYKAVPVLSSRIFSAPQA
jgi:predicted RNA binding protein YcfA (HicA-like mRNA interferase family)